MKWGRIKYFAGYRICHRVRNLKCLFGPKAAKTLARAQILKDQRLRFQLCRATAL